MYNDNKYKDVDNNGNLSNDITIIIIVIIIRRIIIRIIIITTIIRSSELVCPLDIGDENKFHLQHVAATITPCTTDDTIDKKRKRETEEKNKPIVETERVFSAAWLVNGPSRDDPVCVLTTLLRFVLEKS